MMLCGHDWALLMVDREILEQRSAHVLHHLSRLSARRDLEPARLRADEDLWNAVLMDLQQAIQGCIDLATHRCVDEQLGSPTSAGEAFALLARAGRVSGELAVKMTGAAGLRNLIVHQYAVLDVEIIVSIIRTDLGDLEDFLRAMSASP
jgi:uncharacterized protein YutE (UPF0331/DUF86 family)